MEHFVWARVVWASVDLVARAGLPVDPLFEGLPFDARSVRKMDRVSWDDYCSVVEAVERVAGGPDACAALLASGYHQVLPEVRHVAGALVTPKQLLRVLTVRLARILSPPSYVELVDLGPNEVRLEASIVPGARACRAYLSGSRGAIAGVPCHLGLPPAEVEAEIDPDGRGATYHVHLPPARTIPSRVNRRVRRFVSWVVLGVDEGGEIGMGFSYSPSDITPDDDDDDDERALRPKQRSVLNLLATGLSNKEIAASLGCAENTVEYHVSALLRRYRVRSRVELVAKSLAAPHRRAPG